MTSTSFLFEEKLAGRVCVLASLVSTTLLTGIIAIEVVQSLLTMDPSRWVSVFQLEEMRWLRGIRRMIEL